MTEKPKSKQALMNTELSIPFDELFRIEDIQRLQDLFADANGVASIITFPDGTPITKPSNFCRLCSNIIRETEKGRQYCYASDALIGRQNLAGPHIQQCLSGGLWDAGASISVGGEHVANWLIGQVRNENLHLENMARFAEEIGADKDEFMKALEEVPVMSPEQFEKVSNMLFAFAKDLSEKAYTNLKLKKQSDELEKTINLLKVSEEYLATTLHSIGDGVITTDANGLIVSLNPTAEKLCEWKLKDARNKPLEQVFKIVNSKTRQVVDNPVKKVIKSGSIVALGNHIILISKSGNEYQISDSAAPIKNKDGFIQGVVLVFSDVTEKYNAQEKIRISENQFHYLYDNMVEGVAFHELTFDQNGEVYDYQVTETNSSYEKQLGIKKTDVIGKTSREAYGVTEPPFIDIYAKVAKTGKSVFFETYFPPMDKYFSISVYQTMENGFATIFDDISARKRAAEELKDKEERWKRAIASSPVPIMIHDEDDKVLQISSGWTNFSGYTIDDIPTLADWTEKAYGERSGFKKDYINQLFTIDNSVKNGEWIVTAKNGLKRIWDFQTTPLGKDKNGKRILHSMAIDITEQKQAEEELFKEQLISKSLLDSLPGIFYLYSYPELQLVRWNKNHETLLGYKASELKNMSILEWHEPEVRNAVLEAVELVMRDGRNMIETPLLAKDGRSIPFILTGVRIEIEGKIYLMGVGFDNTDHKKAEEEIKFQNEKLHKINSEKDKFFSIIAHDLKNPFNSILGFSELLAEKVKDKPVDPNEIQHYSNIILNSSNRVMDLLTNLMEWSRSQTGRIVFNPTQFDLLRLVTDIELLFTDNFKQKSIVFEKEISGSISIYADVAMISTILRNLISNAIKFTSLSGKITISAEQKANELKITISDTGVGIPESAKNKLFRIDENYSTRGTQNEEGTGLGLILCKEFVEKIGGKIGVESELGKGSEFTFTIPVNLESTKTIS